MRLMQKVHLKWWIRAILAVNMVRACGTSALQKALYGVMDDEDA